jgi:hypothetical protein
MAELFDKIYRPGLDPDIAPLNSPHLTGVPTAPTAPPGTSTTQLATTEFVGTSVLAQKDIKAIRVVSATRERLFYAQVGPGALDGVATALAASKAGDRVELLLPLATDATPLRVPANVSLDLGGFNVDTQGKTDGIRLLQGTGTLYGHNATVTHSLKNSWGVGWVTAGSLNYRIYDLNIRTLVDGTQALGPPFSVNFPNANVWHSGDIYSESPYCIWVYSTTLPGGSYEHVGKVTATNDCIAMVLIGGTMVQRGDVVLSGSASLGFVVNASMEVRGGVLDMRATSLDRPGFYMDPKGRLTLIDVTVLGALPAITQSAGQARGAEVHLWGETTLPAGTWDPELTIVDHRPVVAVATGPNPVFTILPTETVGGIQAGQSFTGTSKDYWTKALIKYQPPAIASFTVNGRGSTTYEIGTSVAGAAVSFSWATSNPDNVAGKLTLTDVTGNATVSATEPASGSDTQAVAGYTVVSGESRRYRIAGKNTEGGSFSGDVATFGQYCAFYGAVPQAPSSSAGVRALPNSFLIGGGAACELNTGDAYRTFVLWLPPGRSLTQVLDFDALGANITGQYIASPLSVADAGGTMVPGTLYAMTQAVPYRANHRHQITIG